ncbi:5-hydroxytryptamine receptor 3A-like [Rhinatrema bivittatum]|uniref:5-hydroxytryptamine receptor 3A-like n=1 Tax=Rhinatrema bivittatum TaxID=194408 RepID=UPI00112CD74A|nr:5-hydroxytryptamine receptor 3A-like [Rhinatrema bivittatum]
MAESEGSPATKAFILVGFSILLQALHPALELKTGLELILQLLVKTDAAQLGWPFTLPWNRMQALQLMLQLLSEKRSHSAAGPAQPNCITVSLVNCSGGDSETFLDSFSHVFSKKAFRPAHNLMQPTVVNISITLYAILGVNEKDQLLTTFLWLKMVWFNDFIEWDPAQCGQITNISVPVEEMWTPDIFVLQFVDEDKSPQLPYLFVQHTGQVRYLKPMRVVSSCRLSIFHFPFDIQNCSLTFGSFLDSVQHIKLGLLMPIDQIESFSKEALTSQGEWELVKIENIYSHDMMDMVNFNIILKRRPSLYVVNLLIPSAFLMLIDVLSFNLPPHTVDRASFKMTLLLGYTVFLLILNDLLPATASGTPLIGIYFSLCLALLVIGLLETVFVMNILHRGSSQCPAVPTWARSLVLHYLASLVCYRKTEQFVGGSVTNSFIIESITQEKNAGLEGAGSDLTQSSPQMHLLLRSISSDLQSMRKLMENYFEQQEIAEEWLRIGLVLDALVYRMYLLFMLVYTVILGATWGTWYQV